MIVQTFSTHFVALIFLDIDIKKNPLKESDE